MLTSTSDFIREQKARFARDVEYIRETALDDVIDERTEVALSKYETETVDELKEAAYMVNRLEIGDEVMSESTEIQRILDAKENITFEEMVGIE